MLPNLSLRQSAGPETSSAGGLPSSVVRGLHIDTSAPEEEVPGAEPECWVPRLRGF